MNNTEFIPGDNDCITMVSQNRECHPGGEPYIVMTKQQAMALLLMKQPSPREEPVEPEVTRQQLILQLCHGLIPICIGMAWVLAAFEGLADPAFTSIITGACIGWGCVEWKWVRGNA